MPNRGELFSSAEAYDRYIGRYGPSLAEALIEFAGVKQGMRAVDVGCGPGALTSKLAALLGSESVSAADPSEPFAEVCRARLPGVTVVVAPAEALPFEDNTFDAALSQLVVNFMTDAHAGVGELARVTRRGGTVASCVWDYAGEMTLLRAYWDAAHEVASERAAAFDEGTMMRWCSEAELETLWGDVGLQDVRTAPLVVEAAYADFEDLWAPLPTGIGPAGAFCASLDENDRRALHDTFKRRLGSVTAPSC